VIHVKDRIKELRRALDLTQDEFGGRIGITKSSISTMESGRSNPSEQTLRSMCREFGASYLWLTTGEGSMFENGNDDAALHVMVDRVMASENERVKQIFKNLGDFTEDDWRQVNAVLDKLLAGMRPWEDEKKD
jgi:transcriptional regulator with XRE-family HTH domain